MENNNDKMDASEKMIWEEILAEEHRQERENPMAYKESYQTEFRSARDDYSMRRQNGRLR